MSRFTGGWIKLHREIIEKDLSQNPFLLSLWVYLLCIANYRPSQIIREGQQKVLERGQILIKIRELSDRWECSPSTIHKWLHYLQRTNRISIDARTRGTVVTICNYDEYQYRQEITSNTARTPAEHQPNYREEGKKERSKNTAPLHPLAILWNETTSKPFPKVLKTEGTRLKTCNKRIVDQPDLERWKELILKIIKSDFCQGKGKEGWIADFDWFIKPQTETKILEGKYDNRENSKIDLLSHRILKTELPTDGLL